MPGPRGDFLEEVTLQPGCLEEASRGAIPAPLTVTPLCLPAGPRQRLHGRLCHLSGSSWEMTVSVGRKSRPEGRGVRHPTHASDCWAPRGEAPPSPLAQAGSPRGLQPVPRGVRCDSPPRASPHPSLPTRAAWEKTSRSDPTGPTASQHRGRGRSATCAQGREGTPCLPPAHGGEG